MTKRVREVARKLCWNEQDFDDCVQRGLFKIFKMPTGDTEAFYIQGAKFIMRDYLKKVRLYNEREQSNTIDLWSDTDAENT